MKDFAGSFNFLWKMMRDKLYWVKLERELNEDFKITVIGSTENALSIARNLTMNDNFQLQDDGRIFFRQLPLSNGFCDDISDSTLAIIVLSEDQADEYTVNAMKIQIPPNIHVVWAVRGKNESIMDLAPSILKSVPSLELTLARNFPLLREYLANELIIRTGKKILLWQWLPPFLRVFHLWGY